MSIWYYADADNTRQGPVDGDVLAQLLAQGRLRWDALVWRDGMADWRPATDFADELTSVHPVSAQPAAAVQASAADPASQTVPGPASFAASAGTASRQDSPYAPPAATLLPDAAVHAGGEVVYAGFWKRVAAYVIDGIVVSIASYAVQLPLLFAAFGSGNFANAQPGQIGAGTGLMLAFAYLIPIVIQMVYFAWFHASAQQATLGKLAIGIKVVDERGGRISFLRGVARYFSTIVSSLILCIGYIMAGFTERKQALHDMMCSTLVVDKWAFTANPEWQRRELGTVTVVILVIGGLLAFLAIAGIAVAIGMAARYGH